MPRLLIVDDDPSIRTLLMRALQTLGDIDTATGGLEALRALGQKRYDCILLDLHMPGVDGFAVLKVLFKQQGLNRDTPIYVLTADTSEAARATAFQRRAMYFLTKPISVVTLRTLVSGTLNVREAKTKSRIPPKA